MKIVAIMRQSMGEDDLIDDLLEHNPDFRKLLEDSLASKSLTIDEALARLK